ncbi:MAG: polysaccharide deacetylase family protein [Clostridiales bacterium]|nr:polysaccharide deacetylase family protein [Clostridiales bacterium]
MKIFSFRLRSIIVVAAVILAAAAGIFFMSRTLTDAVSADTRLIPIYNVETSSNNVAISFNFAEKSEDLDKILSILEAYDVKATFFLLGLTAESERESVEKIYSCGHEIGNHSYSHSDMTALSEQEIADDIQRCNETVKSIIGVSPTLFRAPSGSYDNKTILAAGSLNMTVVQWDTDSLDWTDNSAEDIFNRVTESVQRGSIIQFHTGTAHTAEALPQILDYLTQNNFTAVTVGELIYRDNYTIDYKGTQIKADGSEQ